MEETRNDELVEVTDAELEIMPPPDPEVEGAEGYEEV